MLQRSVGIACFLELSVSVQPCCLFHPVWFRFWDCFVQSKKQSAAPGRSPLCFGVLA